MFLRYITVTNNDHYIDVQLFWWRKTPDKYLCRTTGTPQVRWKTFPQKVLRPKFDLNPRRERLSSQRSYKSATLPQCNRGFYRKLRLLYLTSFVTVPWFYLTFLNIYSCLLYACLYNFDSLAFYNTFFVFNVGCVIFFCFVFNINLLNNCFNCVNFFLFFIFCF